MVRGVGTIDSMILPQVHLVASNLEALHCPHTAYAAEYYPSSYELSFSKRIPLIGRLSARTDYILSQRGIKLHTSPRNRVSVQGIPQG